MKKTTAPILLLIAVLFFVPRQPGAQQTGHISYTLNRVANPSADQQDAYTKIKAAMDEAVTYYNTYTSITKSLSVNYVPDVATADASFNGTMRFGKNRSYMVVLTALHEIAHTVGVGTTNEYKNLILNGVFTGAKGTAMLKEVTGDPNAVLKGDQQHFWPYGLNYASEFNSTDDYVFHCKIVNAMYQDMFQEALYTTCYLRSVSSGRYMTVAEENTLILGEKADPKSLVRLIALSGANTFRMEFGELVLDIPNESVQPGVAAGVWTWNGGGHQKAVFEFDPNAPAKSIARIKMVHSGLYLRQEGDRIIQDNANTSAATQQWELFEGGNTDVDRRFTQRRALQQTTITYQPGVLKVFAAGVSPVSLLITNVFGRQILRENVYGNSMVPTSGFTPGIYIVSVRGAGAGVVDRFVVR